MLGCASIGSDYFRCVFDSFKTTAMCLLVSLTNVMNLLFFLLDSKSSFEN